MTPQARVKKLSPTWDSVHVSLASWTAIQVLKWKKSKSFYFSVKMYLAHIAKYSTFQIEMEFVNVVF